MWFMTFFPDMHVDEDGVLKIVQPLYEGMDKRTGYKKFQNLHEDLVENSFEILKEKGQVKNEKKARESLESLARLWFKQERPMKYRGTRIRKHDEENESDEED